MPLHDHFRPPLNVTRPWEGFHSAWAAMLADQLNATQLPPGYVAMPHVNPNWATAVAWNARDLFEVRVLNVEGQPRLVAAMELISPANKDRPAHRETFAGKCAGYLRQGI